MAAGVGDQPPKISGLIELHKEFPEAFEASLIERGLRWRNVGSAQFDWSDCWAVVNTLPFDSPLSRAQNPEEWVWGHPWSEHIINAGEMANAYKAVLKGEHKFKKKDLYPTRRPGDVNETKIEADVLDINVMRERLGFAV